MYLKEKNLHIFCKSFFGGRLLEETLLAKWAKCTFLTTALNFSVGKEAARTSYILSRVTLTLNCAKTLGWNKCTLRPNFRHSCLVFIRDGLKLLHDSFSTITYQRSLLLMRCRYVSGERPPSPWCGIVVPRLSHKTVLRASCFDCPLIALVVNGTLFSIAPSHTDAHRWWRCWSCTTTAREKKKLR